MARVVVDTSAVYALLDRSDANHPRACARLAALRQARAEPILTNFLVAECHALLLVRLGADVARRWLERSAWRVERVLEADELRAREIVLTLADKEYSYVDAATFAVMERLHVRKAFTYDRHFRQFGWDVVD